MASIGSDDEGTGCPAGLPVTISVELTVQLVGACEGFTAALAQAAASVAAVAADCLAAVDKALAEAEERRALREEARAACDWPAVRAEQDARVRLVAARARRPCPPARHVRLALWRRTGARG